MKFRGLLLAAAVLAVLVGLLYWSNRDAAKTSEASGSAATPATKILPLNLNDIVKVEIKKPGKDDVTLAKDSSGSWRITAPKDFAADQGEVSTVLSALTPLTAERVVDDKTTDLHAYGLAPPAAEFDISETGNKSQQLLLGDETPTRTGTYAALAGDPRVFTVGGFVKTTLDKSLNDLRDRRFLTVDVDKINRLELLTKKSQLEFDHYKDHWQIVKPQPMRAAQTPVEDLIHSLTEAKIDLNQAGSDDKLAASFAKAEALGTIKVTSDTATQELNVRKVGEDYYAKSNQVDVPHKVSNEIGKEFDKTLDDFRNKNLFDFGFTDPSKIEFHDGSKSYFLTKGGSDWWGPDGKKMDATGAYFFLNKLRELKADKFSDSGFNSPTIEITVIDGNSGPTEKVEIAKNDTGYLAKRENDPALYQLDATTVQDMEKAAADVKPEKSK